MRNFNSFLVVSFVSLVIFPHAPATAGRGLSEVSLMIVPAVVAGGLSASAIGEPTSTLVTMAVVPAPADVFIAAPSDDVPEVVEPTSEGLFADDEEDSDGSEPSAAELFEDDFEEEDIVEEEVVPDVPVSDAPIPPVIDRPLGVDEGVQIIVKSFVLDDARNLPEYGIALDEIDAILDEYVSSASEEGLAIGRLQTITEAITAYYRSRGLILAQVVLPVQGVENGEVHFQVFEGVMGRVMVEDNEMYTEGVMREPFEDLIGRPVVASEVEAALLQLTDFPGLTVFGLFQPGQYVGEADLILKVQNEERLKVPVRVDNQGTQSTGRLRVRATMEINNPTKSADRLIFSWQEGFNPDNQLFWSVNYERYLGNGYIVALSLDRNKFQVGGEFADRDIRGVTKSIGGSLEKQLWRSRQGNFNVGTFLTSKSSATSQAGRSLSLDELTVLGVTANYDSVDTVNQALNFATLEVSFGFDDVLGSMGSSRSAQDLRNEGLAPSRSGPDNQLAEGKFSKVFLTYTRLQTLTKHQSMLFRTDLQWSDDLLVSLEQYSAGGPDNVRAYPVAEMLWDRAAFASLEYLLDAPFIADAEAFGSRTWGELLQFSLFYDVAVGSLNDPLPTEQQGTDDYRGFGVGFRFNVPGTLSSRVMFAWPHGKKDPSDDNDMHVWTDLTVTF